jgi:SAM-dependent methyltransferase
MSEAYGAFAYAFDKALGARFWDAARELIERALAKYPTERRTHLDVACGTGLALEYFRSNGWSSTGVDASLPMLRIARSRSERLVAADMRALPFRGTFARITCLYDSLNHLLERNDLVAAFRAMRAVMDDDSLLLFDMNHPDIYPEVWGVPEPFVAEDADFELEMHTRYASREKMGYAVVTGWAMVGGKRVAIRERRRQRAYTEREIVASLAEARLRPLDVIDFDPYHELKHTAARTVKVFFVAGCH